MCDWSARLRFSGGLRAECGLHPRLNLLIEFRSDRATYLLWRDGGRHDVFHQRNLYLFLSSCAKTGKNSVIRVICLLLLLLDRTIVTFHAWCMTFVTCVARVTFGCHGVYNMLLLLLAHLEIVGVYWGLCSSRISLYPLASLGHHDATSKGTLRFYCDWHSETVAPFRSIDIVSLVHLVVLLSVLTFRHLL